MTLILDPELVSNTNIVGSRVARIDPDTFRSQSGAAMEDDEDDMLPDDEPIDDEGISDEDPVADEPLDEDGDPTGEHDHRQDDNYALGGHVARTSGV